MRRKPAPGPCHRNPTPHSGWVGFIQTWTGRTIDFDLLLTGHPVNVHLWDVAHGLAHEPRWGAQAHFISVAEHSLIGGGIMRQVVDPWGICPIRAQLDFLLHDGHEAYLKDIPRPLKRLLAQHTDIYARLSKALDLQIYRLVFGPGIDPDDPAGIGPAGRQLRDIVDSTVELEAEHGWAFAGQPPCGRTWVSSERGAHWRDTFSLQRVAVPAGVDYHRHLEVRWLARVEQLTKLLRGDRGVCASTTSPATDE